MNADYYREIRERLTGLSVPIVVANDGGEIPLPSEKKQKMHGSLAKLMPMPEFADFFGWMRQRAEDLSFGKKASTATADELRVTTAFREFARDVADGVVNFVAEIDGVNAQRKANFENRKPSTQENNV